MTFGKLSSVYILTFHCCSFFAAEMIRLGSFIFFFPEDFHLLSNSWSMTVLMVGLEAVVTVAEISF